MRPEVRKTEKSDLVLPCTVKPSAPGQKVTVEWVTASNNELVNTGANTVWINRDEYSANLTIKDLLTSDSGAYRFVSQLIFC